MTLVPLGVEPPFGPSVKSQAFPDTSAASAVAESYRTVSGFQRSGPIAACACASVGKFSMRQYSGPAGSCLTFFSATGLTTYFTRAAACGGAGSQTIAHSEK